MGQKTGHNLKFNKLCVGKMSKKKYNQKYTNQFKEEVVKMAIKYLRQSQNITILHGDIHYDNILHDLSR